MNPLFVLIISFLPLVSAARNCVSAQDLADKSIPTVDFCALIKKPDAYGNKVIRVKAVLVENHSPRVDGGDPILYGSRCHGSDFSVTVTFSDAFKTSSAYEDLQRIREKPDESGNTRAVVTLVGQFEYSGHREFGHLNWANSQIVIHEIETAASVDNTNSKPGEL